MVDHTNGIWRTSDLCCKSSTAWLLARGNFMSPTHCSDVYERKLIVHGEPNSIRWHFEDMFCPLFIVYGSLYRSLTSVGVTQAHPNSYGDCNYITI